jgi:MYXO-CTERM domain-containing protein
VPSRPQAGRMTAVKHSHTWAVVLGLAALLGTGTASAHIKLRSPTPRDPNNPLKSAPCGPAASTRGSSMTMLTSGQKLTVSWDETIQHPGHYRIAFDSDGQDFPDPMSFTDIAMPNKDLGNGVTILLDGIMDKAGAGIGNTPYTAEVTLPDIECTNCTLQLIQVMTDKAPYGNGDDIYHECANLVLKKAGGAAAGSGAVAAGSGGAGAAGAGGASGAAAAGSGAPTSGAAGSAAGGSSVAGAPAADAAGSTASAARSSVAGSLASGGSVAMMQAPATAAGSAAAAGALAPVPAAAAADSSCAVASAGTKRDHGLGSAVLALTAVAFVLRRRRRPR